jgi:hypothetical protein
MTINGDLAGDSVVFNFNVTSYSEGNGNVVTSC